MPATAPQIVALGGGGFSMETDGSALDDYTLSLTGSQMQVVAINWHVYLLTKSPLALGFVGLTRVVPLVAFSLGAGRGYGHA